MKYLVFGTGGFAREVAWIVESSPALKDSFAGFLDDQPNMHGKTVNGFPVLGGFDWLASLAEPVGVFLGVGNPTTRHKIARRLKALPHVQFPALVHPSTLMGRGVELGEGCIICAGNILTCNISFGRFVNLNLDCTVGHDARLDDFVTVAPGVHISGNVTVGEGTDLGTGAALIQGVSVGRGVVLGAGAVVNRDLPEGATAVGVPAKAIKTREVPAFEWP